MNKKKIYNILDDKIKLYVKGILKHEKIKIPYSDLQMKDNSAGFSLDVLEYDAKIKDYSDLKNQHSKTLFFAIEQLGQIAGKVQDSIASKVQK